MDAQVKEVARLGAGDVLVMIDGDEMTMKPSYTAARVISAQAGGIAGAIDKVVRLDIDTIVTVLQLGLGFHGGNRPPKDFAERVWRSGLTDDTSGLAERCVLYLRVLAAGGKLPKEKGDDDDGKTEDPR